MKAKAFFIFYGATSREINIPLKYHSISSPLLPGEGQGEGGVVILLQILDPRLLGDDTNTRITLFSAISCPLICHLA